jgi:type I restriction enzyme M protein
MMGEINKYVENFDEQLIKGGERAKRFFESQKNFYLWAKEYVYGIEKDYRLAKTTKISTFLNGDGDANIIFGDGLDSFKNSGEYRGLLKISDDKANNEQFDILVANPPYSVSGFKTTLKNGKESFGLFDRFSDKSSEIECLFIERAKQLVKENGCVGIILPSSILTNSGVYTDVRNILFKYFEFKAIVELGSSTFMATNTNTVVLFLKKISSSKHDSTKRLIDGFINNRKDVAINNIDRAFSKYAEVIYDLDLNEYISLFDRNPSEKLLKNDVFDTYLYFWKNKGKKSSTKHPNNIKEVELLDGEFFKYVIEVEKQKMLNFFVSYNQKIILSKTPESNQKEKSFLGYEFSGRRGNEGIKTYTDSRGKIVSKLYNEDDVTDKTKLNSYILKNYKNEAFSDKDIVDDLRENVGVKYLYELVDYSLPVFDKKITPSLKKKLKFNTKYSLEKLGPQVDYFQGLIYDKDDEIQQRTSNRIVTASNIDLETNSLDMTEEKYLKKDIKIGLEKKLNKNDLFICTSSGSIRHLGKVALLDTQVDACFGGFCAVLRTKNNLLPKYLYSIFNTQEFRNYVELRKGQNINNLGKDYLLDFKMPLPPLDIQRDIVKELDKIDEDINELHLNNQSLKEDVEKYFSVVFNQYKDNFVKIESITNLVQRGKSAQYGFSNIQVIKSGQIRGYYNFDFSDQYFAPEDYILDQRKLEAGDILINSTGVGTAGRVNYFNLKGDYIVDSHVTIVRLKKDRVLPKFVLYSLGHIGFSTLEKMAEGQSGQIELSPETIKNIRIPLPDIVAQEKILVKLNSIEEKITQNIEKIKMLKIEQVDVLKKYL